MRLIWSTHRFAFLAWSVLCALFFATLLLGQERLPSSDFTGQFFALAGFQAREWSQGQIPLWAPGSYAGFPFAADTQSAAFYPPRLLIILLFPSLPLYALQLEVIFHVWLAGLFTYGLAYSLTRQRAAAFIAALAFGLGGYLTSYPLLQVALLETIIWLPLALWLIRQATPLATLSPEHRALTPQSSLLKTDLLLVAGLVLGMAALAGHPQTFMHINYVAAAYYLFRTHQAGWPWLARLKWGLLLGITTLGAAAALLLPALNFLRHTTRSDVTYAFIATGIGLEDFLQMLLPGTISLWVPHYVGLLPLLLVTIVWLGRKQTNNPSATSEITFWIVLTIAAAWLALGDAGILFQGWAKIAPGFSLFRQQERLLGVVSLGLALLAAQGWRLLKQMESAAASRLLRQTLILWAGVLGLGLLYLLVDPRKAGQPWPWITGRQILLLALSATVLLAYLHSRGRLLQITLFLLLALDLFIGTYASVNRQLAVPEPFWQTPPWLQTIQTDMPPLTRLDSQGLFYANLGPIYGLEDVAGLSPLKPQKLADLEQFPPLRRWQLLAVSHVLAFQPPDPALVEVGPLDGSIYPGESLRAMVYRLDSPLPRARMIYEPIIVRDPQETLARLADPAFDPARQLLLADPAAANQPVHPPTTPPQVEIRRENSRTLSLNVTSDAPGFLLISEWAYPGWRVMVNGAAASVYDANYAFQAIWLPAGTHVVTVQFRPWDVPLGAAATLLTFLTVLGWLRWGTVRQSTPERMVLPRELAGNAAAWLTQKWLEIVQIGLRLTARPFPLLLALTWLAFLLRLITLSSQELRGDEAYSFPFTRIPLAQVIPTLAPVGEEHAPLHYLLLNIWTKLAGDSELALRFPAVIPGVLVVPLIYHLGRQIRGRRLGLFLALMLTVSQSVVWLSQDVRNQYIGAILLTLLTTLTFMRAIALSPTGKLANSPWLWYTLTCALTMYTHYFGVFALLAHGLCLLVVPAYRRYLGRWLLAGAAAALLFAPWLLATIGGWVGQLDAPPGDPPQLASFLVTVGRELTVGPAFGYAWGRWLFLGGLLLCLYGLGSLWLRQRAWAIILVSWLGLTALGVFLVAMRRYIFNDYYIAPATVAWWTLVGLGVQQLWRRGGWGQVAAALASFSFIAAAAISLSHYYSDSITYGRTQGAREVAAHIITHWQPGDVYVSNFPDPILPYYLRHLEIPQTLQPSYQGEEATVTEAALAQLANQYERLWFVPNLSIWDPEQVAYRWLEYHLLTEQKARYTNLSVVAYRPLAAAAARMRPLDQTIGAEFELQGAHLTVNGVPTDLTQPIPLAPGDQVELTLLWYAAATPTTNYTVFVHLLAADGFLLASGDGVPLYGTRPTTTWQAGERLLDRHLFTVPENLSQSGGWLTIGLYDPITLTRLFLTDGQDALQVSEWHVGE